MSEVNEAINVRMIQIEDPRRRMLMAEPGFQRKWRRTTATKTRTR